MRTLRTAFVWAVAGWLASCAGPAAPPAARPVGGEFRQFLLDPSREGPTLAGAEVAIAVERGFADLLAGGSAASVRAMALSLANRSPSSPAGALLAAQAAWVRGDNAVALTEARGLAGLFPEWPAAALLHGRLEELSGDEIAAFEAYRRLADVNALAAERSRALGPRVVDLSRRKATVDLERGDTNSATIEAARLLVLAPRDPLTHGLAARLARLRGDDRAELESLRRVASLSGDPLARDSEPARRASLEIAGGDAAEGLRLLQELARLDPHDAAVADALAAGKFSWRLQLLPEAVRRATDLAVLTRGDLARLAFWLIPEVRAARPTTAQIVVDVLDHPAREEIVRIVNLQLMPVDEGLRAFAPERPASRGEGMQTLLRAQRLRHDALSCLGAEGAAGFGSIDATCASAARCGWIDSAASCLPTQPLAAADWLAWVRRALTATDAAPPS